MQREHQPYAVLSQHRIDPDLADPWAPEIVLVNQAADEAQRTGCDGVLDAEPQVTMAAVVVGAAPMRCWTLRARPVAAGGHSRARPRVTVR